MGMTDAQWREVHDPRDWIAADVVPAEGARVEFASAEARDAWIERSFPDRRMTDTPGFYDLDGGGHLGVFCNTATVYAPEPALATSLNEHHIDTMEHLYELRVTLFREDISDDERIRLAREQTDRAIDEDDAWQEAQ